MQPKGKAIASMSVGIVATSISVIAMILPFFLDGSRDLNRGHRRHLWYYRHCIKQSLLT